MHWTHAIWIWDPCAAARHTQNTRLIWSSTLLWVQLDTLASQSIAMQYSRHWTPLKGFWWGLIYHRQYRGSSQDVPRHLFLLKHSSDGPSSSRMPPQELHKDQQCFPAHLTHESKIACMACTYGILRNGVQSNSLNTQANQGSSGIDLKKRDTAVALSPPSSLSLNLHAWTVYKLFSRSTTNVDLPLTRTVATRARIQTSAPMAGLMPSSPKVFTLTKGMAGDSTDRMVS